MDVEKQEGINERLYKKGWWLQVSPLARLNPEEEWVVGVLRKGKASWITETCKSGFRNPDSGLKWGKEWIATYKLKQLIKNK